MQSLRFCHDVANIIGHSCSYVYSLAISVHNLICYTAKFMHDDVSAFWHELHVNTLAFHRDKFFVVANFHK